MTRVDFYLLERADRRQRLDFCCRLVEKAWHRGHRIYVHTGDAALTRALDERLWTFRAGSFVPHQPAGDDAGSDCPVLIGHDAEPPATREVLVNLAAEVPLFFSRFPRLAEVVSAEPDDRDQARERYRFYRERGYDLHTHRLEG